jgi:hypothetical protein
VVCGHRGVPRRPKLGIGSAETVRKWVCQADHLLVSEHGCPRDAA